MMLAKQVNSLPMPEQVTAFFVHLAKPLLQERQYVPHVRLANIKPLLALAFVQTALRVDFPSEQVTLDALIAILVLLPHQQASRAALGAQQVNINTILANQRAQRVMLAAFLLVWAISTVIFVLLVLFPPLEAIVVPHVE